MAKRLALFAITLFIGITLGSVNVQAEPPVADAGIDQSAFAGSTVTLSGLNSSDPEAGALTYLWQQVDNGEPIVDLIDAETPLASFVMPATLTGGSQLLFSLEVTDLEGLQAQDDVVVSNAAQIDCDVAEGFQFPGSRTAPIGHLNSLQIGDTILSPDLNIKDPSNPDENVSVVGVLESINWNNVATDPLSVVARLSATNRDAVNTLLTSLTGTERILLKFSVYEYDSVSGAYYKSFHSNTVTTAGGVDYVDSEAQIAMDQTADSDMVNPENYSFSLAVAADDQTTHHLYRTQSTGLNVTWIWGDDGADSANLLTSAAQINFGIVEHGTSPSQFFTIENDGTSDLHIGQLGQFTPAAPFGITNDGCSGQILAAGERCDITVNLDASLIAALLVPTTGTLAIGLIFFGSPGRRKPIRAILMMIMTAALLIACGSDRSWQTAVFHIPSNDPGSAQIAIGVIADVEKD